MKKNYIISKTRERIFTRDGWRCQYKNCCNSSTELAHIIGQGEYDTLHVKQLWHDMFGENRDVAWIKINVIYNDLNMVASCRQHNDDFDIGNDEGAIKILLQTIYNTMKGARHEAKFKKSDEEDRAAESGVRECNSCD